MPCFIFSLVRGGERCCRTAGLSKATFYFLPLPLPLLTVAMVTAGAHRGRSLLSRGRGARVITLLSLEFYFSFFFTLYFSLYLFLPLAVFSSVCIFITFTWCPLSLLCTPQCFSLTLCVLHGFPPSLFSHLISFIFSSIHFIDLTLHSAFYLNFVYPFLVSYTHFWHNGFTYSITKLHKQ